MLYMGIKNKMIVCHVYKMLSPLILLVFSLNDFKLSMT